MGKSEPSEPGGGREAVRARLRSFSPERERRRVDRPTLAGAVVRDLVEG